ncbi:MAG: glucosamine-6-phosphate deaminase [Desulfobacteraceae bacterium]|nr:MAG: glucosamine-6-phosphate deaminase [Desulfobacteraceae bacterium]
MKIEIFKTKSECSAAAAEKGAEILRKAIADKGKASFIVATGASQFDFLKALTAKKGIDWGRTAMYHLDEYIGFNEDHPASFRRYLKERLVDIVRPGTVHFIEGEAADPAAECRRIGAVISRDEIDVAFVGIGENGHLAFNDPPADFDTEAPYIIVKLDQDCRKQQFGEGWFAALQEVPTTAISMSIRQIMKSEQIICTVPDARKARAVRECFEGEISPMHPASILHRHPKAFVYLDEPAASLLSRTGEN